MWAWGRGTVATLGVGLPQRGELQATVYMVHGCSSLERLCYICL